MIPVKIRGYAADFDRALIIPKKSSVGSRKDVTLQKKNGI